MTSRFDDLLLDLNKEILDKFNKAEYVVGITRDKDNLIIKHRFNEDVLVEMPLEIKGLDGKDGDNGLNGKDGKDGLNGLDGKKGEKGEKGERGKPGFDGKDGKDGLDGKDGKDGKDGLRGKPGLDGKDGKDGADVIDAKIDNTGHLIITTNEKTIDAGVIRRFSAGLGKNGGGGGGSEYKYTNTLPTPTAVGGFAAGTTFDKATLDELFTGLFYASGYPSFSYFVISGLVNLEVGGTIQGQYMAQWLTVNSSLIEEDSIVIYYENEVERLAENLPDSGSHLITIPPITFVTPTTATFLIQAFNTSLLSFNKTFSVDFLYRVYIGESELETLTSEAANNLRLKPLKSNIDGEYDMLAGQYKWFCFPSDFGARTKFFDVNTGFDVEMDDRDLLEITNQHGVTTLYYCYRTYYKLGGVIRIGISE